MNKGVPMKIPRKRNPSTQEYAWIKFKDGYKYISKKLNCFVLLEDTIEERQDCKIPSWNDLTYDGELLEDQREAEKLQKSYAQWKKQGWWPKPVTVKKWKIFILLRTETGPIGFESDYLDSSEIAIQKAEEAIPKLLERRRPSWLNIIP